VQLEKRAVCRNCGATNEKSVAFVAAAARQMGKAAGFSHLPPGNFKKPSKPV